MSGSCFSCPSIKNITEGLPHFSSSAYWLSRHLKQMGTPACQDCIVVAHPAENRNVATSSGQGSMWRWRGVWEKCACVCVCEGENIGWPAAVMDS